jgi:hypothetical protein
MPLAGLIVGWDIATDVLFLNYWLNLFTIQFLARLHVNLSDGGMENNKIEINMQNTRVPLFSQLLVVQLHFSCCTWTVPFELYMHKMHI